MNTIRVSHHDLPNPAKRISELEAELLRVRAALAEEKERADGNFASYERVKGKLSDLQNECRDMLAERDALRARAEQAEAALSWWESDSVAGRAREYYSGLEKDNADLRAELEQARAFLALANLNHGAMQTMLDDARAELTAERDALRARLAALEAAAQSWKHYLESNDMTYYVVNGVRHENEWYVQVCAALAGSEMTK